MTYEEALFYAKSYMRVNDVPVNARETTKCIVEALEKQIRKKPVQKEYMYGWTNYCPACKKVLFRNSIMENGEIRYCKHCGQALDWSDAE